MSIRGPVTFQAATVPRGEVQDDSVHAAVGRIAARYPQVVAWYGRSTGHWWAVVGDRLLEACTPWELEAAIHRTTSPPVARPAIDRAMSTPVADAALGRVASSFADAAVGRPASSFAGAGVDGAALPLVAGVPGLRSSGGGFCGCGCMQEDARPGLIGRIAGRLHLSDGGRDAA
ncbi:hypothetical protein [Actinomadura oligospora]|uniref:hypothetical protein n=1 Tax=Actinomadura oligospora TaxID=111804 RepID=UPI0012FB0FDD|nr:hypothetical protein [Actinomadura oligospora]